MAKSTIIKELANGKIDLHTSLKRTKVLLQEFDDEKLLEWVNYEIEGYPSDVELPKYRRIPGQPFCTYIKGPMTNPSKFCNVPLSLGNMPENEKEWYYFSDVRESIEVLKRTMQEYGNKDTRIARTIPAECYPYISKCNNDMGMVIQSVEVRLNASQILNIFPKVENKLLDILMYLEKQFGNLDNLDIDVDSKSEQEIKEMTNHIMIIIYNDQSITIGDKNKINNSNIVSEIFKQD